jgi:hypothetical protein
MTIEERIAALDISLFENIECQIHNEDKRSLLTIQNATRNKLEKYSYLEIGSHLGGSIQPHLIDPKCEKIYSIDSRPFQQPDDRKPGHLCTYVDNSTSRMLNLLSDVDKNGVAKIQCFDSDASEIDPNEVYPKPQMIFIDGEHTKRAVLSDFEFCSKVVSNDGAILFHDAWIVYPAIQEIIKSLKRSDREFLPVLLDGFIIMILFDVEMVQKDPNLKSMYKRNYWFLKLLPIKKYLPRIATKLGRYIQRRQYRAHL